jgi:hypothetical protein
LKTKETEVLTGYLISPVHPIGNQAARTRNIFEVREKVKSLAGVDIIQTETGKFFLHVNGRGRRAGELASGILEENNFIADRRPTVLIAPDLSRTAPPPLPSS